MKSNLIGGNFKVRCMVAGLVLGLLPLLAQAATNRWIAGDGMWDTAGNWSVGVPSSSDNYVYITNTASKTVTINSSTAVGSLTVSNLVVEAPSGYTNTLLLSGNTTPLTCLSAAAGVSLSLGNSVGKVGALVVDGGSLVTTNAAGDDFMSVGYNGVGALTISNGMWQGNDLYLGYNATGNGTLNLIGGTNSFNNTNSLTGRWRVGNAGGAIGTVWKNGGLLVTTNAICVIGYNGVGFMTASNGFWQGYKVMVPGNSGRGALNLFGGTNQFSSSFQIAPTLNTTGSVTMIGGRLIVTNAAANNQLIVARRCSKRYFRATSSEISLNNLA